MLKAHDFFETFYLKKDTNYILLMGWKGDTFAVKKWRDFMLAGINGAKANRTVPAGEAGDDEERKS